MEFTVYVLYSESSDRLYIGYTSDLLNRMKSHQYLSKKGFTVRYRPWKMIHVVHFEQKASAMQHESYLKSGQGRSWIRSEILPLMRKLGFIVDSRD